MLQRLVYLNLIKEFLKSVPGFDKNFSLVKNCIVLRLKKLLIIYHISLVFNLGYSTSNLLMLRKAIVRSDTHRKPLKLLLFPLQCKSVHSPAPFGTLWFKVCIDNYA